MMKVFAKSMVTTVGVSVVFLFINSCGSSGNLTTQFVSPLAIQKAKQAAGDIGHNTTSQIISLQYYVTRIQLCENLTVSGSGYSGSSGCITVFGSDTAESAYDTFKIPEAEADTSSSWVDIVNLSSSATATASVAGTYSYGIVETRKPIKLNAAVTIPNGSVTVKTCTGGIVTNEGSGLDFRQLVSVSNMATCTQGLATLGSNGGGQWFKFQKPVTLEPGKTYVLDLASNPENAVMAYNSSVDSGTDATYSDSTYKMLLPPIALVPIVREGSQKTIREQYELSGMSRVNGKIVVDLYFAGSQSDVGTGTVVGAGARFVNNSSATTVTKIHNPYAVSTNANGTLAIKDYAGNAIVDGLTRSTTATAGGTGTATVHHGTFLVLLSRAIDSRSEV